MNNSPSNIFFILNHQNCLVVLTATGINGLKYSHLEQTYGQKHMFTSH